MCNQIHPSYTIGFFTTGVELEYSYILFKAVANVAQEYNVNLVNFLGGSLNPDVSFQEYKYQYQCNIAFDYADPDVLDGIILASGVLSSFLSDNDYHQFYSKFKPIPMVSLGAYVENMPSVYTDNKSIFKKLVSHLIQDHGKENIVFLSGPSSNRDALDRYLGYKEALTENHIPFREEYIQTGDFTPDCAAEAISHLFDCPHFAIDAIVCANDSMALAVLNELKKRGITVPEQVALTGFDNIYRAAYSIPSLSTIEQPLEDFAHVAFKLLFDYIQGKPVTNQLVPCKIILRDSCGCNRHTSNPDQRNTTFNDALRYYDHETDRLISNFAFIRQVLLTMTHNIHDKHLQLSSLIPELIACNIHTCLIYLYDHAITQNFTHGWQMPEHLTLYMGYVNEKTLDTPTSLPQLTPKEIVTYGLTQRGHAYTSFIHPIFFGNEQLGMIVLELPPDKYNLIETLTVELGCALKLSSIFMTQKSTENKLEALSQTDELTGLLNRRGFFNKALINYKTALLERRRGILFYADMDGLKLINDTCGHSEGDLAIITMSNIFKKVFTSPLDILARMGGDEFTILCLDRGPEYIQEALAQIETACEDYNNTYRKTYHFNISIGGVPFFYDTTLTLEELLSTADKKLYSIKKVKKHKKNFSCL